MATSIETQARTELSRMEDIVTAVRSLTMLSASLQPQDMNDFALVAVYLGDILNNEFEAFHRTVSQRVLPLVADITSGSTRHQ